MSGVSSPAPERGPGFAGTAGSARRPDVARSCGTLQPGASRPLGDAAAVFGRRSAGELAKDRGKCACLAEADIESDLCHREFALRQQRLGAFNAAAGQISVWRHAKRLLEGAGKVVGTELCELGQSRERNVFRKVLLYVLRQLSLLAAGESTADVRLQRRDAAVQAHELVGQRDAERLDVGGLAERISHLRLQLESGGPEVAIEKEQVRPEFGCGEARLPLQQRAGRIDVEECDARQRARLLPAVEPVPRGNKGHPAVPRAQLRLWQSLDQRFPVVAFGPLGRDQQMTRRYFERVIERLMPDDIDVVSLDSVPSGDLMP